MPEEDDYITVAGAARLGRTSQATIRRWLREGKLRKYKGADGRVWVDRNEVIARTTPRPAAPVGPVR